MSSDASPSTPLVAVSTNVDNVLETVRDILVKVELIARGQELLATAVSSLHGAVTVGFKDLSDAIKQMATGVDGGAPATNAQVAETLGKVQTIKRGFREREMKRIAEAARSADVYLDTARTWNDVTEVTMQSLDMDRSAAAQWLLSTIRLPTRRDASVLVAMRACVPILRAKPHLMQTLKEIVCSAFFAGIGQPRENLSPETSTLWLNNQAYLLSERGRPSFMTGMAGMLRHVGANDMVKEALNFGARPVIHATTGHIALGSCFVRATLESKAGVRSGRRSGVGEGIYDMWVAELARVDAVLPRDDEVHSGLRLIDGRDVNRAVVDASGNGDGVVLPHDIHTVLAEVANDQVMADAEAAADGAAGPAVATGAGAP
ncbi:hypothetical protein I4F81_005730 [Pyropia yezoensis]|uniref:Uncharacterized protein n=1 Tax=Pyropia yezoensis TaxID=2788 RepID=A0ACC3BZ93_PYRYE|nr:hypothetical protein I4F81_005730 [Neopyropia yezoensis]